MEYPDWKHIAEPPRALWDSRQRPCLAKRRKEDRDEQERTGDRRGTDLAMLLVVADEVSQLLLEALQGGVQLLHLAHQVGLLAL